MHLQNSVQNYPKWLFNLMLIQNSRESFPFFLFESVFTTSNCGLLASVKTSITGYDTKGKLFTENMQTSNKNLLYSGLAYSGCERVGTGD